MSAFEPFMKSAIPGITRYWRDDGDGNATLATCQDVSDILEGNKAKAAHNDGYTKSRDMARIASIPLTIIYKWMTEEGWDPFSSDPDCQKKLAQKLDSNEYRYLRTSEIILGDHWRHSI